MQKVSILWIGIVKSPTRSPHIVVKLKPRKKLKLAIRANALIDNANRAIRDLEAAIAFRDKAHRALEANQCCIPQE